MKKGSLDNKVIHSDYRFNTFITIIERYGIFIVLIIASLIFGSFNPKFLTGQQLENMSIQLVPIGLLALGSFFVLISGGLDLTIGVGVTLAAIMLERFWFITNNITISLIISFSSVLILGLINSLLITKLKLNSIIATLVMMTTIIGVVKIVFQLSNISTKISTPLFDFLINYKILKIPISFIIMIGFYIVGYFLLNHTRFGTYILAIGGNSEGARIAGIKDNNYLFFTYIISGLFMGLATLTLVARLKYIQPTIGGTPILLDVLTALIIGGVAIGGGKGTIQGVFIGTIAIALINSIVIISDVDTVLKDFVKGFIIVLVLLVNRAVEIAENKRK